MKRSISMILALLFLCCICPIAQAAGYTVVIEPQYNIAGPYYDNVAKVSANSKWSLVDIDGASVSGSQWTSLGDTDKDLIPAEKNGKWGYIDQTGKVVIPYQFTAAGAFHEGLALVYTEDYQQAYINQEGNICFFSPFDTSFVFSGGAVCGVIDDLYGFCDTEGNIIIAPQFTLAHDFHEGYAAVQSGEKWGYVTSYGIYSIRPAYDYCSDFQNGYAICLLNGKYGIIDTAGNRVAPFTFDYIAAPDAQGRYPAKSGNTTGYIAHDGSWILKTSYDFCYAFTDGVARVYDNEMWGFIDENGNELIPPTFFDCGEYRNGRAPFSTDGTLWGYLTLDTTQAVPTPIVPAPPQSSVPSNEIVDWNPNDPSLPLAPDSANCLSMRIGSKVARIGDKAYALSAAPALLDGTTMIPVRDAVELLGGTVNWNAAAQRVNMTRKFKTISMTIDSKIAFIDGTPVSISRAPVLLDGSTMVPLRSVTDGWGFSLKWMDTEQNIYIYFK